MICPRCGYEMKEEHLYCERCGAEIRIVPDFEPEIQNSIEETLSTVAEEINPDLSEIPSPVRRKTEEEDFLKEGSIFHGITSKKRILITTLASVLMTLIIILLAGLIYQNYSTAYQINQAEELIDKEQFERALSYLVKAEKLQPEDTWVPYMQAECYYALGEAERAAEILENVVFKRSMDEERKIQYFDFIITILAGQQDYERINELLMESGDTAVQTQFQHYMAMKPEFGYSTGNYEKVISLKITANTTGTIYYTTDGSEPQEHSLVYTAPIQLEPGEHRIKAVFVNDYGIRSETVENYYLIDVAIPEKPEVTPSSGNYQLPTLIEVIAEEEGNIYYTTDGSEPDENSLLYTEPIDMPLGRTNYRFAVISEEGVMSEVVYRSYDFELQTQVTVKAAIDRVKKALMDQHILKDMQGNSFEIEGRYVYEYETLVEISNLGYYYKLSESIVDSVGNRTQTGRLYAVEVYSGTPNRLVYDENGQMGIIPLNK